MLAYKELYPFGISKILERELLKKIGMKARECLVRQPQETEAKERPTAGSYLTQKSFSSGR